MSGEDGRRSISAGSVPGSRAGSKDSRPGGSKSKSRERNSKSKDDSRRSSKSKNDSGIFKFYMKSFSLYFKSLRLFKSFTYLGAFYHKFMLNVFRCNLIIILLINISF